MSSCTYDFIFITETWTNSDIPNSILRLNYYYDLLRDDRLDKRGGGVLIFFRKSLQIVNVEIPEGLKISETLAFDLILKHQKIRFLLVYRSPKCDEIQNDKLCNLLSWIYTSSIQSIVLGDFNYPLIRWNNTPISEQSPDFKFYTTICDLGYYQYVTHPTLKNNIRSHFCIE